jgi:hypothetical protein
LTQIKLLQTHTPRHIIAGSIMGLVLYLFAFQTGLFPAIHWYHLVFFSGIGLLIYLAVLYLLREFTKKDFEFFVDLLHPFEMVHYITSEIKEKDVHRKRKP